MTPKALNDPYHDEIPSHASTSSVKSLACNSCNTRKTRCDKTRPSCSACQRGNHICIYEEATTRGSRKRKPVEDVNGFSEDINRILNQHGAPVRKAARVVSYSCADSTDLKENITVSEQSTGKLTVKERSKLWNDVENHGLGEIPEEVASVADADYAQASIAFPSAMLSRGLLGNSQNLDKFHPSAVNAVKLWKIYKGNVEPLYRFLHTPSAQDFVMNNCQDPADISAADQSLLFAIYLLAVYSIDEDECRASFGQDRDLLLSQYDYGVRQALYNANWLCVTETSKMFTLVAFVMCLSVVWRKTDSRSLWIWTGMATRIMQRMGIHRDGEEQGLSPFDVELRRRLYWHVVSIDSYAGRVSGSSDAIPPTSWDTKFPSNINDDQLHPHILEAPKLCRGTTDMLFSLVQIKLRQLFAADNLSPECHNPANSLWDASERIINSVENEIEAQFLRYCDPVEPIHALTLMTARAAIAAARLRQRWALVTRPIPNRDMERSQIYGLARRVMDAASHAITNPILKPFRWFSRGSIRWEALCCLLSALAQPKFFSAEESEGSWSRVNDCFIHHPEAIGSRSTLQRTIGPMTLIAWLANPDPSCTVEPEYITKLRSLHVESIKLLPAREIGAASAKVDMRYDAQFESDNSFDINMFLNSGIFGDANAWDGLADGTF